MTQTRKAEAAWIESRSRWQINIQKDGVRKTFTSSLPGKKGKAAAERLADQWLAETHGEDLRFGELWQRYLDSIDTGHSSAHKTKMESIGRCWLLPRWKNKRISTLTNNDYKAAVRAAVEGDKPLSAKTCQHIRAAISAAYNYAADSELPMTRPHNIAIPKAATVGERTVLTPEHIAELFRSDLAPRHNKITPDRLVHAYRFAVVMGLRRGEIVGLQWPDISGATLTVNRSVNSLLEITPGKTQKSRRRAALPQIALTILDEQRQALAADGIRSKWIFPDNDGSMLHPNKLYDHWRIYRDFHSLPPVSFHELRHSMVSLIKNDMPLPLLKDIVGHTANMDTLNQYGHELPQDSVIAAGIIDSVYRRMLDT